MIISLGHKYIFVHALKTAGTSMALTLEARAMKDDIILGDTPKAVKRRKRFAGCEDGGTAVETLDFGGCCCTVHGEMHVLGLPGK